MNIAWRDTSSASISSSSISNATRSLDIASGTSRRTAFPKRRRRNSISTATNRSSASSSSTERSALRVTRKAWHCTISIPGNRRGKLALTISSMLTNVNESGNWKKRGKVCGSFTRANRSSPDFGSRTTMAKLSAKLEMYGNGCAGSTASGVSTGKIRDSKTPVRCSRSIGDKFSQVEI